MPNRLATRVFGKIVPAGLLTYFACAWYICSIQVGLGYLVKKQQRRTLGVGYILLAQLLIGLITRAYLHLLMLPIGHGRSSPTPSDNYLARSVVEVAGTLQGDVTQVSADGANLPRCFKGACGGRWKPPKTRHCGVCGTCQVGFDHHCPWFDNCLTATHYKAFLHLVVLTPIAVVLLTTPLWHILPAQLRQIFAASYQDAATRAMWWDWWPSWVIIGGPIGRWVVGGWLGIRVIALDRLVEGGGDQGWGALVAEPSAAVMILILFGIALATITSGLAFFSIRTIFSGELTIDGERRRAFRRLANIAVATPRPLPPALVRSLDALDPTTHFRLREDRGKGKLVRSAPGDKPYDLGRRGNWDRVMGSGWNCFSLRYRSKPGDYDIWEVSPDYTRVLEARVPLEN